MIKTNSIHLNVPLHPINILSLSNTGVMPNTGNDDLDSIANRRLHEPHNLPPRNRTENQLLSIWINTHQAMFMTIAMSAYAVLKAIIAMHQHNFSETLQWLMLAREARFASAAYTDLPVLTQPLYEAYVRESMKLVHPGFSGVSNSE